MTVFFFATNLEILFASWEKKKQRIVEKAHGIAPVGENQPSLESKKHFTKVDGLVFNFPFCMMIQKFFRNKIKYFFYLKNKNTKISFLLSREG